MMYIPVSYTHLVFHKVIFAFYTYGRKAERVKFEDSRTVYVALPRFAGINVNKNIILSLAFAGALAGLAGAIVITGAMPHRITTLTSQPGYGFDGISVALMANTSPLGVIASALLFAGLQYGGSSIQADLGAPSEIINIVIGTIIFFIAMSGAFRMLADYLEKRRGRSNGK